MLSFKITKIENVRRNNISSSYKMKTQVFIKMTILLWNYYLIIDVNHKPSIDFVEKLSRGFETNIQYALLLRYVPYIFARTVTSN
jgi:hypothetical protein